MKDIDAPTKQFAFHLADTLGLVQKSISADRLWEVMEENKITQPEIVARALSKASKERREVFFEWAKHRKDVLTKVSCMVAYKELEALQDAAPFHFLLEQSEVFTYINQVKSNNKDPLSNPIVSILDKKKTAEDARVFVRPLLRKDWSKEVLNDALLGVMAYHSPFTQNSSDGIGMDEVVQTLLDKGARPEECFAPGTKSKLGAPLLAIHVQNNVFFPGFRKPKAFELLAAYYHAPERLLQTLETPIGKLSYLATMARTGEKEARSSLYESLKTTSINWWDGDPYGVVQPLLMEVQSGMPDMLSIMLDRCQASSLQTGLSSDSILPIMKRVALSLQAMPLGLKEEFLEKHVPRFALLWKDSVEQKQVSRWAEELALLQRQTTKSRINKIELESFFEKKELEFSTSCSLTSPRHMPRL